jgi:hypothetical protein
MPTSGPGRNFASEDYFLELGGLPAGRLDSFQGGDGVGLVVEEKLGADSIIHKHIAGLSYEDITATCGPSMSSEFYAYIKATLNRKFDMKDGAIKTLDSNLKAIPEMQFFHGRITEIDFPALDAASKDAAKLTIKIKPEYTRTTTTGSAVPAPSPSKRWLASNFSLAIPGLDCTHVTQIDALTIQLKNVDSLIGDPRTHLDPPYLDIPNLVVTLPESHAQSFRDWHKEFVVDGNNGAGKEKSGTLAFLTEDLKGPFFTLNLKGLGIFRMTRLPAGGSDNVSHVKVEMYCESIDLTLPSGAKG